MSDPAPSSQQPTQPTGDPAQPQGSASQGQPAQPTQPPEPPQGDPTDWKAEARKWEARAKENKGAADRLAKLEDANKSETQKLLERAEAAEKRATEADQRYRTATIRQSVIEAATGAHALDAETVYLHLQARGGIDVADDGKVTGVDEAIKALAKDKPHLFAQATPGSRDAAHSSGQPPALNSDTLEQSLRRAVGAR